MAESQADSSGKIEVNVELKTTRSLVDRQLLDLLNDPNIPEWIKVRLAPDLSIEVPLPKILSDKCR